MDSGGSITKCIEMILSRSVTGGGFAQRPGSGYRPDATAWGVLALPSGDRHRELVENACRRLAASQLADGRVPVAEAFDTAYWPTPLAVLAWKKAARGSAQLESATKFLLETSGLHAPREKNAPTGHDTAIRGWSWIENTHSWIEPTCMAILALKATGNSEHGRVQEAVRMILDRQLSSGGWNYGNTTVFNQELLPAKRFVLCRGLCKALKLKRASIILGRGSQTCKHPFPSAGAFSGSLRGPSA
jgi:hypothetical protein